MDVKADEEIMVLEVPEAVLGMVEELEKVRRETYEAMAVPARLMEGEPRSRGIGWREWR